MRSPHANKVSLCIVLLLLHRVAKRRTEEEEEEELVVFKKTQKKPFYDRTDLIFNSRSLFCMRIRMQC